MKEDPPYVFSGSSETRDSNASFIIRAIARLISIALLRDPGFPAIFSQNAALIPELHHSALRYAEVQYGVYLT